MLNLFLAYAHPDSEFAKELTSALEQKGYNVWDWYENLPGSDWGRIFSAIEESSAFLFIISPRGVASPTCLQELRYAQEQGKTILPLLRTDVLEVSLPLELRGKKWILARDDSEIDSAVDALSRILGSIPSLERQNELLMQSLQWRRHGRDSSFLLRGTALREAQELTATSGSDNQAAVVLEFVQDGVRAVRRRTTLVVGSLLATALVLAISAALHVMLPVISGLAFAGGVVVTFLCMKAMGFSKKRELLAAAHKTEDEADVLGPETIFVSYGRADWDKHAKVMVKHLRSAKMSAWVDQRFIEGGDDWMDAINTALSTCQRMVLCITPTALDSKYVKKEYRYFIQYNKPIYPIMCEQTTLPFELQGIQWLDIHDYEKIVSAIRRGLRS